MKALGKFTYSLALMLYRGWALTHLWRWFVMPIFDTLPLGAVEAVGLVIVTSIFQSPALSDILAGMDIEKRPDGKIEKLVVAYVVPAAYTSFVLVLGWAWHLFV